MAPRNKAFGKEYIEKCFLAWMAAGAPDRIGANLDVFPLDESGRRPGIATLSDWSVKYDWRGRADLINAKAIEKVNAELVDDKATLLRQQYEDSKTVLKKALEYIVTDGFDSSASAVSAVFKANEEMRRAIGISEIIEKMSKMSNEELEREILDKIRRASEAGQIIDGDISGEEDEDSEE